MNTCETQTATRRLLLNFLPAEPHKSQSAHHYLTSDVRLTNHVHRAALVESYPDGWGGFFLALFCVQY